ncbi:hydrogen peroxide-inducible genes activator (plasmid) [Paroceanicella profunda]|uniref:Hydrogen peroxide-inducible genes activator n=1 Tax=Paroceanicella profunda TaxID=2579971 RepID=A0A5B8G4H9_9RHOB|nr:hydrogen peroxide-inducible genes activator [Paroceanicella profunda]QDL93843.1 hydrogen peroxide-inducible genes activator [Paroceanicella profunda]
MLNVNLRHLHYLVTLAETGNFGAAAARAGITQSTLSAAIRGLEEELGAPLMDRSGRRMQLLPFGETVVERARDIIAQVGELPEYAARSARPLTTRLRLGMIPSVAPFVLPKLLRSLRAAHPDLSLSVREGLTQSLLAEIRAGRLDAAFIAHMPSVEEFEYTAVAEDPFLVALPPRHPLSGRAALTLADLASDRLLLLDQGHCLREHVLTALGRDGLVDEHDVRAASIMTLVQLVDFGTGITLLPRIAVDAGAVSGTGITLVRYESPSAARRLVVAWRARSYRRSDYLALAEHIRRHCLPGSDGAAAAE